ncbi:MAG: acyl carrier protein [Christensenellales bacterium]|uniref:Acyl carrier protein n=1 Tax=Candidatus Avichristensenella intestinipullorum TaxID=2840693 RepID=A0A9D1CJA4_9FIRM|nr:acyl carrier protein [Christensenellales bacterium]HIQ63183.1 acyl carrier protein [Candidatus Avichristensenella intestinipullorum]
MFERVAGLIAEQLKIDVATITPQSRLLEDLNADSANIMMLIMDLESELGIMVEDDALMRLRTVGDVVEYIEKCKK